MKNTDKKQSGIEYLDPLTADFINRHRGDCAYILASRRQILIYSAAALGMLVFLKYRWDYFLFTVTAVMAFWYFSAAVFRISACCISMLGFGERKVSSAELTATDEELPAYTILVPLYKEANIAEKIIRNISNLDYPEDKLDVKLLLESDDRQTLQVLKNCSLPWNFKIIVVPDALPKTKPRACNFGLKFARGEFCVIYDAEDRPEPDQLKKAVAVFRSSPDEMVCVQAKLNYYNSRQNLLTRLFTIEYSTTFDLMLPGMQTFNVPLPLGGTSNHFRTSVLRELGGWDPFNVTEDCDLGIRIYKHGCRTCLLDSTTWEEANSDLWNWIRQRSRWVKGFIQTHLSHTRYPLNTLRQLGIRGFFGFYLSVGASSFMMLVNIIYWIAGGFYLLMFADALASGLTPWEIIAGPHNFVNYHGMAFMGMRLEPWPLFYWGETESRFWSALSVIFFGMTIPLVLANFMLLAVHILACVKRRYYHLLPAAMLMPFYWILISLGAWKGFIQLFFNPSYWEKTIHGLDSEIPAETRFAFSETPIALQQIITVQETTTQTADENKIL
ncbi:MAG: glycosyltransferase [Victivallaceae bacterium]